MVPNQRYLWPLQAVSMVLLATVAQAAPKVAPPVSPKAAAPVRLAPKPVASSAKDALVRRLDTGPLAPDTGKTRELQRLEAAERELFPTLARRAALTWPSELPTPRANSERPLVDASGVAKATVPPPTTATAPPSADTGKDTAWLTHLALPDLPIRWDSRLVRYLEFFKDDPRGRSTMTAWFRRSGRYRDGIRRALRKRGLPEDLVWLAMVESGFDPAAKSHAGAVGLWQFMPDTAKLYGLPQDRWLDARMNFASSTEAAAEFLSDLHRKLGSWDLAMAAYNMGAAGVVSLVRRYNTNDYWALAKLEGSLPWETTLYVPKILAVAIVSRNLQTFGYHDVDVDAPLEGEEVSVAPNTSLSTVASACGVPAKDIEALNPDLRAARTPPQPQTDWPLKVPAGKAATCNQSLAKLRRDPVGTEHYVVRFGESLEQIAEARHTTVGKLVELNALVAGEPVRGGTVLNVPRLVTNGVKSAEKTVVIVPRDVFVMPNRRRVFYRVQLGDNVRDLCASFHVTADELRAWNAVDPSARLLDGMSLQLFVPKNLDVSRLAVLEESDVRTVVAGTDDFFELSEGKGRRRVVVVAKAGDTLESIGKKHSVSIALMEKINRRGRSEPLATGDNVVVWAPADATRDHAAPTAEASNGPPPSPDLASTRRSVSSALDTLPPLP
jgi:membrane-bound lytic murein transglycosylase D